MRDSAGPWNRTRMRVAELSSISAVWPAAGLIASSDSADPFQLTVIEPPDELYVFVNGAGPCVAIVLDVLLEDELDELLDDELDEDELDEDELDEDELDTDCAPTDPGGCASTVGSGTVDSTVCGLVVTGATGTVARGGDDTRVDVSGATTVDGEVVVAGGADVSGATEVDGSLAGASVSSALPSSSSAPPAMTAASVAPPARPARRRRILRARVSTAP